MASCPLNNKAELTDGMADLSANPDHHHQPPYTVVQHIERYDARPIHCHISSMRPASDVKEIRDLRVGCMCDNVVVGWIKRQWIWGRCSATDALCHFGAPTDPSFGFSRRLRVYDV